MAAITAKPLKRHIFSIPGEASKFFYSENNILLDEAPSPLAFHVAIVLQVTSLDFKARVERFSKRFSPLGIGRASQALKSNPRRPLAHIRSECVAMMATPARHLCHAVPFGDWNSA
ncbi:hypothetical protein [Pararhizobium sp.]|uniref:hypothetical protein n=1 Tax=Pararhizobium sp. TaxID=1977563 RepID=UPI00271B1164|nr:hypothetical protein [Pararhizobium sp.]MDO9416974.1 hypothetical protein [Pararhizobium sp.]